MRIAIKIGLSGGPGDTVDNLVATAKQVERKGFPAAREKIGEALVLYGQLPSYKAMLEREGVTSPADIALVGDEAALRDEIQRLRDAGVTDLNAAVMPVEEGGFERTTDFLASQHL